MLTNAGNKVHGGGASLTGDNREEDCDGEGAERGGELHDYFVKVRLGVVKRIEELARCRG